MDTRRPVYLLMRILTGAFGLSTYSRVRSDVDIDRDAQSKIHEEPTFAVIPISVQPRRGGVVLSGRSATEGGRDVAENAAKQINGAKRVIKRLQLSTAAVKLTRSQSKPVAQTAGTRDFIMALLDGDPITGSQREPLRRALRCSGFQFQTVFAALGVRFTCRHTLQ